ncbi:MAG TPA: ABC-F family ATP-binding cassette domain-containing protein [Candidatus Merdivicinus excrementipullorum]|uniref:ABC-F family ATP-binding cassette domain-containing protein n=1 Tax=Candidatus Merdivicinus excrementipullorum TaxID=2840867 RepID=A0A9D1K0L3_9FIRM|nr:ABC-F family ATP-binding cassette domain-containing protein [Candidatus Merdivicinus excrementipullorum]
MLVSLQDVGVSFGSTVIFNGVTAQVQENSRIGLIGANGAGKSTLLNVICGSQEYETGALDRKSGLNVGYLRQNSGLTSGNTIEEEMRLVFAPVLKAKEEMERIRLELSDCPPDSAEYQALSREYDRNQSFFEGNDGYLIDVKIQSILNGMGFEEKDTRTEISTLSGGEKTRLALAKLLLSEPELLILDEPTNHLDFKTLLWLEDHLESYKGAVVVVSHDRYFLDKTVKEIWEMEFGGLRVFPGNYSKYKVLKAELMARWEKEYEAQQEEIADLEDYIAKNLTRASTSKMAKGRIKKLEAMEMIERPREYAKKISLRFDFDRDPVKDVLIVEGLSLSVGEGLERKHLFDHLDVHIQRGEKVAVIGENGIGKSSFLHALRGELKPDAGKIRWGQEVKASYFDQENRQLHPEMTVIEELWSRWPRKNETEIRTMLGRVLLQGEDVYKKVGVLSGGERAKLAFAVLMMERGNFLMLDEPTNHLDLQSKELLEDALRDYRGTLLFVSHDRYLLKAVPDRIIEIFDDHVEVFKGNYDYYLEKQREKAAAAIPAPKQEKQPSASGASYYRSKQQKAEDAKRRARIRELEKLVEELEGEIAEIEETLQNPGEMASDYQKIQELCTLLEEKKNLLNDYMDEWMELSEE